MSRPIREELTSLAGILEFLDYKAVREPGFVSDSPTSVVNPENVLKRGIADLDFDPMFLLGTGKTSPEGWAISNGKQSR